MITVYTIGHSTRSADEFLAILRAFAIELVADIRTVPRSRRSPQFDHAELQRFLPEHGIKYIQLPALGGLRRPRKDSINTGWENAAFRGYADYMQTPEFARAVDDLIRLATAQRTIIMCAEAVPWRCHRSLVGDALLVRGVVVEDILSQTNSRPHKLTPWAQVEGFEITYPTPNHRTSDGKATAAKRSGLDSSPMNRSKLMPDQDEHEKPEDMVEAPGEAEHTARSLAQAADSNATLEGYYSINEIKPPPGEIEKEERALKQREEETALEQRETKQNAP
jgi:Protein of unknown function, DUF488